MHILNLTFDPCVTKTKLLINEFLRFSTDASKNEVFMMNRLDDAEFFTPLQVGEPYKEV